jgi:adenine-specific DNA methylase
LNKPKRLIEVSLPLKAISAQSAREKSIRHGHISTLHIWWARRPLAAMRAAIFASLIPAPDTDAERERLENLIATIVDWDQVKRGNSPAIKEAQDLIRGAFPDGPPRLLDPFMGGGATGLEALRLGCETHAVELNPVAHLIELCTLVYPQKYGQPEKRTVQQGAMQVEVEVNPLAEDVRKWGQWVLERAREQIGHLYENPVDDKTIVGYLWARTVTCPNPTCRAEMPLVRQWWLAKRKGRRITLRPMVDRETKQISFKVVNIGKQENTDFDPSKGTSSRGHATCLLCDQVADVEYVRAEGQAGRMKEMPLAVVYGQEEKGKGYRSFNNQDRILFQKASDLLITVNDKVPDEPIPTTELRRISVPIYGLDTWGKLFNNRQSLALVTFCQKVQLVQDLILAKTASKEYAQIIVTYLAMILDRLANQGANLARWNNAGEKIEGVFARQAIGMLWDYAEVNPFSGATGDWMGALEWVVRVIEHTAQASNLSATSRQGTVTRLPYPESHFDAIITDPPYYDSVPYSHLADFFYVWLRTCFESRVV